MKLRGFAYGLAIRGISLIPLKMWPPRVTVLLLWAPYYVSPAPRGRSSSEMQQFFNNGLNTHITMQPGWCLSAIQKRGPSCHNLDTPSCFIILMVEVKWCQGVPGSIGSLHMVHTCWTGWGHANGCPDIGLGVWHVMHLRWLGIDWVHPNGDRGLISGSCGHLQVCFLLWRVLWYFQVCSQVSSVFVFLTHTLRFVFIHYLHSYSPPCTGGIGIWKQ